MIRYLILAAAVGSGGVAVWMTTATEPEPVIVSPAPAPAETVDVLVAAGDIAPGTGLSEGNLRWSPWPANAVASNFVRRSERPGAIASLSGALTRGPLTANDPIIESQLMRRASGLMSALLPPGKRAVAVRISAESTAGGFVLPNDRVDVVHTVTPPAENGGMPQPRSAVILQNISVMAIDQSQNTIDAKEPQTSVLGQTATLALDLAEVETVTAAQASGTLTLALRSAADHSITHRPRSEPRREEQRTTVTVHRKGERDVVEVAPHGSGAMMGRTR